MDEQGVANIELWMPPPNDRHILKKKRLLWVCWHHEISLGAMVLHKKIIKTAMPKVGKEKIYHIYNAPLHSSTPKHRNKMIFEMLQKIHCIQSNNMQDVGIIPYYARCFSRIMKELV